MLIGRQDEQRRLREYFGSMKAEFVAVYGRRRVGKTFLVTETFADAITFAATGSESSDKAVQLENFDNALRRYGSTHSEVPKSWPAAFELLIRLLEQKAADDRLVVFIDELSWFDTRSSGFIPALEHFWNSWGSAQSRLLLVACGSVTSWIMSNLINGHGGLYNRITGTIHLKPFTLRECEEFCQWRGLGLGRYQVVEAFMVFGGIPHYLGLLRPRLSFPQNIDALCFGKDALLANEFQRLYASLFENPEHPIAIVEALARRRMGLTRAEILAATGMNDGGTATKLLKDLEACGLIRSYVGFGMKKRALLYQLCDQFSLFHLTFMGDSGTDEQFWSKHYGRGGHNAWGGYAFEQVCLAHITQIKRALGISGVMANVSAWVSKSWRPAAQIDLVIDRSDHVINICEMKFSQLAFAIDKDYEAKLLNKLSAFANETKTKKALHLTLVTTYDVARNSHSGIVQDFLTMDDLFA